MHFACVRHGWVASLTAIQCILVVFQEAGRHRPECGTRGGPRRSGLSDKSVSGVLLHVSLSASTQARTKRLLLMLAAP